MKLTEYFVSLKRIAITTEEYNVMVSSEYHKMSNVINEMSH